MIDLATGWKIDLIIRKSRPFSQEEFRRRQRVNLHDASLFLASVEDVIVLEKWIAELGLKEEWGEAQRVAGIAR